MSGRHAPTLRVIVLLAVTIALASSCTRLATLGRALPAMDVTDPRLPSFRLEDPPSARGPHEAYYNAFGDPWSLKGPPNPSIPVILTPSCHRYGPNSSGSGLSSAEVAFLASTNAPLLFDECATVEHDLSPVATRTSALTTSLRSRGVRYVGYGLVSVLGPAHLAFPELDQDERAFVHRVGTVASPTTRLRQVNEPPDQKFVVNIGDAGMRQYIAQYTRRHAGAAGLDGVMVDLLTRSPFKSRHDDALMPPDLFQDWPAHLLAGLAELRAAQPEALIWINTLMRDPGYLESALRYADGLVVEDPVGPRAVGWREVVDNENGAAITRADRWSALTEITGRLGKQLVATINTNINCANSGSPRCFQETDAAAQQRDARYYLAAFLTVMQGEQTSLAFYTPTPESPQFHSAAFFKEWDLPIGLPVGDRMEVAPGVHARRFERALVIWNNATEPYVVDLGDQPLVTLDAALIRRFAMPAKTGMLFVTPELIEPGNPSFELPWGWGPRRSDAAWGDLATEPAHVHQGQRALHIGPGLADPGLCRSATFDPAETYVWSGWVKTAGNTRADATLASGPGWEVVRPILPTGTRDWTLVWTEFTVPEGGNGQVCVAMPGPTVGDVWLDEIRLTRR